MVISSLVVETTPQTTQSAAETLSTLEGVEVHEINEHTIVVTIEAETLDDSHAIASSFISISGVTGINLVYANFEDDPLLQKVAKK